MWQADDSEIDRAIDAVSRQLTIGEPRADLRARVLERLDARRTTRRPSTWLLSPVAVAAAIVIVILFVARERHTDVTPSRATVASDTTARQPETTAVASQRRQTNAIDAHASDSTHERVLRPSNRTPTPTQSASHIDTLAPPRLAVASIQLDDIDSIQLNALEPAESIQLPRLDAIEPIGVAPIGDPQGDRP